MIKVIVKKKDNYIKSILLKGHANYDEYGKDIVCASVSATYFCTINACLSIKNNSIEVLSNNNKQEIKVIESNDIINKLLNNMINCLSNLEDEYSKYIKIDKEEE